MKRTRVLMSALVVAVVAAGAALANGAPVGREAVAAEAATPVGTPTNAVTGAAGAAQGTVDPGGSVLCSYLATDPRFNQALGWIESTGSVTCDAPVVAIAVYVSLHRLSNGTEELFASSVLNESVAVGRSTHSVYVAGACQGPAQYVARAHIVIDWPNGSPPFDRQVATEPVGIFC